MEKWNLNCIKSKIILKVVPNSKLFCLKSFIGGALPQEFPVNCQNKLSTVKTYDSTKSGICQRGVKVYFGVFVQFTFIFYLI